MGVEIERKFLVCGDGWRTDTGRVFAQAYLSLDPARIVRVRCAGERAFLTIKGATHGISRSEYEYEIPFSDAQELLNLRVGSVISKTRHVVVHAGKRWEIDEFHGDNAGLVVAEIELSAEDETFTVPPWLSREVSDDPRYLNANLATTPFVSWASPPAPGKRPSPSPMATPFPM